MKVIIAGGRDFTNKEFLWECVDIVLANVPDVLLISGFAKGADKLGIEWAEEYDIDIMLMPALWGSYGKAAGVKRNEEMARIADTLIAFWNGESRGTKDMITRALKHGLELHVYRY